MRKSLRTLIIAVAALIMMLCLSSVAFADSTELTITNNTNMFKAVTASLETDGASETLVVALSGTGYHELFKGTYGEALRNGANEDNWIHGAVNKDGKWVFRIPLEKDESYVPVVAISNSYYEKYKQDLNPIERAFYPRQMEIDRVAKTLVTGDYDAVIELDIDSDISMFNPGKKADLHIIGGPNSNDHKQLLTLYTDSVKITKYRSGDTEIEKEPELNEFGGYTFKDIPVEVQKGILLESWSASNSKYYDRPCYISMKERKLYFRKKASATKVEDFSGLSEGEAAALAALSATPELCGKLIDAIYVQNRTDDTDALCAAAKACWDALSDEDKEKVEGDDADPDYFGRFTGYASKDDPLNQDEIGENELLVVSFGTSFNNSRTEDIGGIEKALAKANPGWDVRRAFTAQIIINHVQARDGEKIDNVEQALDRAVANGVKNLVIQPTHLMHGSEYDELVKELKKYESKFDSVKVAEPLLGPVGDKDDEINEDKKAVAEAAVAEAVKEAGYESVAKMAEAKVALVFMGHGTSHEAKKTYTQMQAQMKELGFNNVFIGTVEGKPESTALPAVKKAVEDAGFTKVILRPLMVVAGDHANNDMADLEDEGSWAHGFVYGGEFEVEGADKPVDIGAGFGEANVTCQIEGLGRIEAVQDLYVSHTKAAIGADPKAIDVSVLNSEGEPSGMYGVESAVIVKQDDDTYVARLTMKNKNRDIIALGDTNPASIHAIDWYVGTVVSEHMVFVIPVEKLDTDMTVSFNSKSRIDEGKAWSNDQTMKFDSSTMTETEEDAPVLKKEDVDPAEVEEYTAAYETNMFKIVSAKKVTYKEQDYALVALSSTGYHELFKGTYEEAAANGDGTKDKGNDTWAHGYLNEEGKWEFIIPLDKDETNVPITAVSNSYYEKYLNEQDTLERAFYARQIKIDDTEKTMTAYDYEDTYDIAITNNVSMFKPGETATVHVVSGPNNNTPYTVEMTLPMGSDSFSKIKAVVYNNKYGEITEDGTKEIEFKDGKFADVPVIGGQKITLEFWSVKNQRWYKRDLTIDLVEKTGVFDPHQASIEELDGMTIDEAVKYVKEYKSVDLLQALIEAIQVQERDENTDKYCAAAKACWDALDDDDKYEDDGYFSDYTGDASEDDPLNQDEIGEKELLVVSFGTSFNGSRAEDIGGIEKALAKAFPDWSVRRAFTAQIIINHVQARDGEKIDNVEQALERAVANGVKELVVQPTHLMHGAEYDELVTTLAGYEDKFDSVDIAEPLLGPVGDDETVVNEDKETVARAIVAEALTSAALESIEAADRDGIAFVFMGHGTAHSAAVTYSQMQTQMDELGFKNVFIGTVEGEPEDTACEAVINKVKDAGYTTVILRPLMVVAGDHANNDMADPDDEESWYSQFVASEAFDFVDTQIEGLGRIKAVQKLYVKHTGEIIGLPENPYEKINQAIIDFVSDKDLLEMYSFISGTIDLYKSYPDEVVAELKRGKTDKLEEYLEVLDLYIEKAEKAIDEFKDKPEVQEAIQEAIEKAKELREILKEYGIENPEDLQKKIEEIRTEIEKAQAEFVKALEDFLGESVEEFVKEAAQNLDKEIREWAEDHKITEEDIDKFIEQAKALQAILEEYRGLTPNEAIDKAIADAKKALEENADAIVDAIVAGLDPIRQMWNEGDFDEYLEQAGLARDEIDKLVKDVIAYATGYAQGKSYQDLQRELQLAEEALIIKEREIAELKDTILALNTAIGEKQKELDEAKEAVKQAEKDLETEKGNTEAEKARADKAEADLKAAQKAEEKAAAELAKYENALKVLKKKPALKKVKNLKGKKAQVTFKGLKGADATKYQISYKVGKKTKKKTVKKATTTNKTLKSTLKKLKKGNKYTVKVRAAYTFKYGGKTHTVYSKWSKAKKVTIKR